MVPGIRFQVSEVRRPERVGSQTNAGYQQNRGTPFRDATNRDGFRLRSADRADLFGTTTRRPSRAPAGDIASGASELDALAFGTLNRAVQAFSGSESNARAQEGAPVDPGIGIPASVPYEALQRAASAQVLPGYNAPRTEEVAAEEAEPTAVFGDPAEEDAALGAFEKPVETDPFQAARDSRNPDAADSDQLFKAPKEVAQPFGREIPFDLSAQSNTNTAVFTTAENPRTEFGRSGSQPPSGRLEPRDQSEVDRLQARQHDVQSAELRGVLAAGTNASSAQYLFETGPDGKQYAVGAQLNLAVTPVVGAPQATLKKLESVKLATGTMRVTQASTRAAEEQQSALVGQTRAQVANERYRSAQQNQFENVLAVKPGEGSTQRWSRIGIARPTFAISLTV
jgi:hypothetical protein